MSAKPQPKQQPFPGGISIDCLCSDPMYESTRSLGPCSDPIQSASTPYGINQQDNNPAMLDADNKNK